MAEIPSIFDRNQIIHNLQRTSARFADHNFLFQFAARDIIERLRDIKRDFTNILLTDPRSRTVFDISQFPHAKIRHISADESLTDPQYISEEMARYDLVISVGDLHKVNDLPGQLFRLRQILKPDGVLIGAMAGGETLRELRDAFLQTELSLTGGAAPRVLPFVDKQQMAALMQRAGYALPVVDSEVLSVSYRDLFHLLSDIRGMGESNTLMTRPRNIVSSRFFAETAQYYQNHFVGKDGRIMASFEVIFFIGWAPHESQQRPARRGSGQVSLTDVL